jgi:predicted transcriptional regulator
MLELNLGDSETFYTVAHALASKARIEILKAINHNKLSIAEIAEQLDQPISTIAAHIKIMEASGIILVETQSATRGKMKVCTPNFDGIFMNLKMVNKNKKPKDTYMIEMPIGNYTDCEIWPTCGIFNSSGLLTPPDEPTIFYHPDRTMAQLLWFRRGFVEYKFPLLVPTLTHIHSIQFSMEVCSEAPSYKNIWPSDITVWVNGMDIGTWTCPGDFGGERGQFNPSWYPKGYTQFGVLKTWKVDQSGSYIDDYKISDVALDRLDVSPRKAIILRIGIKQDANNPGGINIFGKDLGNFKQSIMMKVVHSTHKMA